MVKGGNLLLPRFIESTVLNVIIKYPNDRGRKAGYLCRRDINDSSSTSCGFCPPDTDL